MPRYSHYIDSPGRVPDWRWKRAVFIREKEDEPANRVGDGVQGFRWIRAADRFRSAYPHCHTMRDYRNLVKAHPGVAHAHDLYIESKDFTKYALEANLLTERSFMEIAHVLNLDIATVEAYEGIFFNVRDSLEHPLYIMHSVIKPAVESGVHRKEHDFLWKLYAYYLGAYVADAVQTAMPNPAICRSAENTPAALRDTVISTATLKASLSATTLNVTDGNKIALLELFGKFIEIARNTDTLGKAQDSILSSIQTMVDYLPLEIGRKVYSKENVALEYDKSAIELKVGEMTHLTVHGTLPNRDSLLELTFEGVQAANRLLN